MDKYKQIEARYDFFFFNFVVGLSLLWSSQRKQPSSDCEVIFPDLKLFLNGKEAYWYFESQEGKLIVHMHQKAVWSILL